MHGEKRNFLINIWYYLVVLFATLLHHAQADDVALMQELAKGLNMAGWSGNAPCKWSGVQCDASGRVTIININSMSVSGHLPSDLNQLSSLQSLNLQRNQLSGPLPSLSNLTSLKEVYFDFNNFTSTPTDFLSGLTSLQTFSIGDNPSLSPWTIPPSLADSTQLVTFSATRANIIGPIPDIFGSFPSLQNLRLSYNKITGPLPPSFAKSGIQNLWLNNQQIGGRIDVIGSMSQVTQVWIHVNNFSGPIPDLSGCKELYDLQLRDNHLTGVIPASLSSPPMLKNVSLQNNNFQGPMPSFPKGVQVTLGTTNGFCNSVPGPCDPQVTILLQLASDLGYPEALAESWKGNNACQNWDFVTCISGKVRAINFARQNFTGTISAAIANLTSLRSLTLSDNHLSGPIPSSLTSLPDLKLLDVSNNNISGKIPAFGPGVTVNTSGNPFIGIDLPPSSPPGSGAKGATPPSGSPNGRKGAVAWVIAVIVIAAAMVVVVLCFVVYRRYAKKRSDGQMWGKGGGKRKKSHKVDADVNTNGAPSPTGTQSNDGIRGGIPIDVLRQVTDYFNEENILGKGGFGIVYKGILHDGTRIAVKRMESVDSTKGLNEFKAEIEVLTKVKHRNLVELIGFCVNGKERLLVYEYMPQGTLGQHLFGWRQRGTPQLSWKQRVSVALDVARGVEYLHGLTQQSFIHRDLKPSNILLGDDMRAKVSDFGLVKNAPDGKHSIETRLAGTFGYLAPEYAATGKVTTKVDVFAFGVILMELITGRKAVDDSQPEDRCHLVTWFRKVIVNKEEMRSSIDPSLEEPDEETFQSICTVADLASHCTARDPYQRPIMGHAVNVLSPLVERWTPAYHDEEETLGVNLNISLPQALQQWRAREGESTSSYLFTNNGTGFTSSTGMASPDSESDGRDTKSRYRY